MITGEVRSARAGWVCELGRELTAHAAKEPTRDAAPDASGEAGRVGGLALVKTKQLVTGDAGALPATHTGTGGER